MRRQLLSHWNPGCSQWRDGLILKCPSSQLLFNFFKNSASLTRRRPPVSVTPTSVAPIAPGINIFLIHLLQIRDKCLTCFRCCPSSSPLPLPPPPPPCLANRTSRPPSPQPGAPSPCVIRPRSYCSRSRRRKGGGGDVHSPGRGSSPCCCSWKRVFSKIFFLKKRKNSRKCAVFVFWVC